MRADRRLDRNICGPGAIETALPGSPLPPDASGMSIALIEV